MPLKSFVLLFIVLAADAAAQPAAATRSELLAAFAAADQGRLDAATRSLDEAAPGSAALARAGASVAWAAEPYNGGTYTAWKPGDMTRYWDVLR